MDCLDENLTAWSDSSKSYDEATKLVWKAHSQNITAIQTWAIGFFPNCNYLICSINIWYSIMAHSLNLVIFSVNRLTIYIYKWCNVSVGVVCLSIAICSSTIRVQVFINTSPDLHIKWIIEVSSIRLNSDGYSPIRFFYCVFTVLEGHSYIP